MKNIDGGKLYSNIHDYSGLLTMKDDSYEYILKDGDFEVNISEILESGISNNKEVTYIQITINGRPALCEEGYLYQTPDGDSVVSYFLCGENIDKFLFEHTGLHMNIYIKITETMTTGARS